MILWGIHGSSKKATSSSELFADHSIANLGMELNQRVKSPFILFLLTNGASCIPNIVSTCCDFTEQYLTKGYIGLTIEFANALYIRQLEYSPKLGAK
jgi:hypothetical protein